MRKRMSVSAGERTLPGLWPRGRILFAARPEEVLLLGARSGGEAAFIKGFYVFLQIEVKP